MSKYQNNFPANQRKREVWCAYQKLVSSEKKQKLLLNDNYQIEK